MTVSTRSTTASDMLLARAIHHAAYRDVVIAQFGGWDEALQDGFFDEDWSRGGFDILLWQDQPCGYAAVENRDRDIHVRELVIDPSFQNRGIGTAFLKSIMQRAAARGVPVRLGTFHRNRALGLYARLGFREIKKTESHILLEWSAPRSR